MKLNEIERNWAHFLLITVALRQKLLDTVHACKLSLLSVEYCIHLNMFYTFLFKIGSKWVVCGIGVGLFLEGS